MPVRRVQSYGRNTIGFFPSLKLGRMVAFESTLERDCVYMLDYDKQVATFEEQLFTLVYQNEGKRYTYTPDFKVALRNGRQIVIECKPQRFVASSANQRKFRAAQQWCQENHLLFQVLTDNQLRAHHRLDNIRLLTEQARYSIEAKTRGAILACLSSTPSPLTLMEVMRQVHPANPAPVMPALLHLAFHHEVYIPIDQGHIGWQTLVSLPQLAQGGTDGDPIFLGW